MPDPVFDDQIVRKLAETLNETQLTEIEYEMGEIRVRVARQTSFQNQISTVLPTAHVSLPPTSVPKTVQSSPLDKSQHPDVIKSPMVGTVYASASPEMSPFVQVGATVTKGQTILIIEAMKVMNQIKAPRDGKITEIFFHNGEPVEYDQPLLILES